MKRVGIYFFFDKDGIVDRYVPYYIQELHKVVDYIVVVANGKLTVEGRKTLTQTADDLFVRQNEGFDVWAYKEAIEYIGWEQLYAYDELVLTNSTVFGPIYPFQEIFERMSKSPCDFWGMYQTYARKDIKSWFGIPLPDGMPNHITSNFHVFKEKVLHCYEFKQFWNKLPMINSYFESNVYYEMEVSRFLSDLGFVIACADDGKLKDLYPNPTVYGAYDAITQCRVPVIRKKAFFDPNGSLDYCSDYPRMMMQYIRNHTNYDCGLIWESLLRTVNLYDLKNWFNWNNVLPFDYSKSISNAKIAVLFHTYYDDIMEQYVHNIEAFPDGTDFYFTTDTEQKRKTLENLMAPLTNRFHIEYRLVENRGRDISALLVGCRDVVLKGGYDLICFMHDKKGIGNSIQFTCVGQSFSDCCFENIAASADYVNNVVDLFACEPRLGLAVPPPPKNANYYTCIGGSWAVNFENTGELLKEMGITVPLDPEKPPVSAYGSVFWFRPQALLPLFNRKWQYKDFMVEPMSNDGTISNAIERVHGFIAQSQGFYTAIIMNNRYAEQEITRMTDIAHTYMKLTLSYAGPQVLMKAATAQFTQMLQKRNEKSAQKALKRRTPAKRFVRGICPIGLWNLGRRIRCAAAGDIYMEPNVERGAFKTVVRACMPRFLWDAMRKAKCSENGWVFVED